MNALADLLKDVLDGLTMVELYSKGGAISQRLMKVGVEKSVCVAKEPPEERVEQDKIIWVPMDPVKFMDEERVQDVGLIYSSPPEGVDQNREVISRFRSAKMLAPNCLVVLEEPAWSYTKLDDYNFFEEIDVSDYDRTKITVAQMVSAMEF